MGQTHSDPALASIETNDLEKLTFLINRVNASTQSLVSDRWLVHYASEHGKTECLRHLIGMYPNELGSRKHGPGSPSTPFMHTILEFRDVTPGRLECIKLLASHSPVLTPIESGLVYDHAIRYLQHDVLNVLLESCALIDVHRALRVAHASKNAYAVGAILATS